MTCATCTYRCPQCGPDIIDLMRRERQAREDRNPFLANYYHQLAKQAIFKQLGPAVCPE